MRSILTVIVEHGETTDPFAAYVAHCMSVGVDDAPLRVVDSRIQVDVEQERF